MDLHIQDIQQAESQLTPSDRPVLSKFYQRLSSIQPKSCISYVTIPNPYHFHHTYHSKRNPQHSKVFF